MMWTDKEIDEFYELLNDNDLIYANELDDLIDNTVEKSFKSAIKLKICS